MTTESESEIVKRLLMRMKYHRDECNRLHVLCKEDGLKDDEREYLQEQSNQHSHIFSILCTVWDKHGSDKGLNEILDGLKD